MGVLDLFRLDGKKALVTGASRGLGLAMATALAEAGADVAIVGRHKETLAEAAGGIASASGRRAVPILADVAKPDDCRSCVGEAVGALGGLDILVNNAGIAIRKEALEYTLEEWHKVLAVNLDAVFLVSQEAAKAMKERGGGRIINISSMTSEVAVPMTMPYVASKGAVRQLTRQLAFEWGQYNILVNAIGPGFFETQLTENARKRTHVVDHVNSRIVLGRWGKPEDLAGIVVYLASPASSYVTGQDFYIDGGFLASY
jgi:NAD(P)-dependent dehydrogenase (short-subunit alcohol dehydrogenase family)